MHNPTYRSNYEIPSAEPNLKTLGLPMSAYTFRTFSQRFFLRQPPRPQRSLACFHKTLKPFPLDDPLDHEPVSLHARCFRDNSLARREVHWKMYNTGIDRTGKPTAQFNE